MNLQSPIVWIVVAAVVAILLIALAVGLILSRRRRINIVNDRSIVASDPNAPLDKSGGYKAASGFSFSQGASATGLVDPAGTDDTPPKAEASGRREPRIIPPPTGPVPTIGADGTPNPTVGSEEVVDATPAIPERVDPERVDTEGQPNVGDDASVPRDSHKRPIMDVALPEISPDTAEEPGELAAPTSTAPTSTASTNTAIDHAPPADERAAILEPEVETQDGQEGNAPAPIEYIAPTAGRLEKLKGRLARSQTTMGKSLLGLMGAGDLDDESWEEVEDTLLMADLGTPSTLAVVEGLRQQLAVRNARTAGEVRQLLKDVLVAQLDPQMDRSIRALPHDDHPSVLLVVGVNGTGKTTTTGKLARVLVADGRRVVLGAADTFRAAAADQLQTWAERVGAEVVRGKEQADPAAVAFDAVAKGTDTGVDVVMIDTAGRLHTKTGLMDELGKVKRVVEKKAKVDEVLLVLDATIGQNGLAQARVFADVVEITGVVLTKLDGTAKGGIVFQVQHELGVPVKLVGLGEGADDLAPFEPTAFVDALLG